MLRRVRGEQQCVYRLLSFAQTFLVEKSTDSNLCVFAFIERVEIETETEENNNDNDDNNDTDSFYEGGGLGRSGFRFPAT